MSLKKDNFTNREKFFMHLALNLARERIGLTGSNPSVGCVIVKNNEIISTGQTSINGVPHAEFNAIKNSKGNLRNSHMYVSLEPCSHYGKTPPCTKIIIKSKIKKLYYAHEDIDVRSSNKAYKILKKNKIIVKKNLLHLEAKNIYKSYFHNKKKKIPYVIGKIATSRDNKIFYNKKYISNNHSRNVSQLLRYKNQGLLASSTTINIDNSKLTCRLNGLEKFSPYRFILDRNLIINKKSFIVETANKFKTFIFYNKENRIKEKFLRNKKIILVKCNLIDNHNININNVLQFIKNIGINYLLVEGGNKLTTFMIDNNLFNEFFLFKANKFLGNKGKINIKKILIKLNKNFKNKKIINTYLDKDELINYY